MPHPRAAPHVFMPKTAGFAMFPRHVIDSGGHTFLSCAGRFARTARNGSMRLRARTGGPEGMMLVQVLCQFRLRRRAALGVPACCSSNPSSFPASGVFRAKIGPLTTRRAGCGHFWRLRGHTVNPRPPPHPPGYIHPQRGMRPDEACQNRRIENLLPALRRKWRETAL